MLDSKYLASSGQGCIGLFLNAFLFHLLEPDPVSHGSEERREGLEFIWIEVE